ncbi:MMPL family transporter, partial [Bacillus cereus]|uniref:MMPL family transporter n=1 Tax=Bacillus cereus TaxID=1396 RepID=UPI00366A921B
MFDRITRFLIGRRTAVLLLTGLTLVLGAAFGADLQSRLTSGLTDYDDPAAANVAARRIIERTTGIDTQQGYVLLVRTDAPIDPAAVYPEPVAAAVRVLRQRPEVIDVLDYRANPSLISADHRSTVVFARVGAVTEKDVLPALERDVSADPALAGHVDIGGPTAGNVQISTVSLTDLSLAEIIVFPALFVLLVLVFRGVVAALLPLAGGAVTVVATMAALRLLVSFQPLSVFALNLVLGLGLGLSIDFSLLIVSRFRAELGARREVDAALAATMRSAGHTVLFSG